MNRILSIIILALFAIKTFAMDIEIKINGKTFTAQIEDTETGRAFCDLLPMTLDMTELNGNEKYHYLLNGLPTNAQYCSTINAGDLMLFGNSCVVLFYGQAGGYSYTLLGKLTSTEGLAEAVGTGNVSVTFSMATNGILEVKDNPNGADQIYDLSGRKLDKEPEKGVFIKNGMKVSK